MSRYIKATITKITSEDSSVQKGYARSKLGQRKFISYSSISGRHSVGDHVILNTLANDLSLGTGGYDIVVASLESLEKEDAGRGHIVKLRYTPQQLQFQSVEEDKKNKKYFDGSVDLAGMPVVVCGVLSQVTAVIAALKYVKPKAKIAFVMTDGGSLPIAFSDLIKSLKGMKLIHKTITCGQSFGGDLEAVNIFSGLLAAKYVAKCDVAIVSIGPGIVGTDSFIGHSGVQQGESLNAAASLGGTGVMVPRVSFGDKRARHQGLSHHTRSVISMVLSTKVVLPVAKLEGGSTKHVIDELKKIKTLHSPKIVQIDGAPVLEAIEKFDIQPNTMGRSLQDDKEFFLMAGVAGLYAAKLLTPLK